MIRNRSQAIMCSKWFLPGFALGLGAIVFAASWIGGHPGEGLGSWAILAAFGAVVLLAGRSETIRGLRGDGRDERFAQIDLRATATTGVILITVVIIGWLVSIAHGGNGGPYGWLAAIAGLTYIGSAVYFRVRG